MSTAFLNLPRREILQICSHLDFKAIMGLRKVNKKMKELVDSWIFKYRKMIIEDLVVEKEKRSHRTCVTITFDRTRHCIFSRNCFNSAFDILKINVTIPNTTGIILSFKLDSEEMRRFFEYLSPLIRNKIILKLSLMDSDPKIVQMLSAFLGHIPEVFIGVKTTETVDFSPLLMIVKKSRPKHVHFTTVKRNDSLDFMNRLADIVKSLRISVESGHTWSYLNILSIILPLLNRKCEQLELKSSCPNHPISRGEIESLLQYLHHSEKRVSVTTNTSIKRLWNLQIGVYDVKTAWRKLTIRHLGMD